MDTGPYMTVPTHPFGTAGDDLQKQGLMESQRLAGVTLGPWQVKPQLINRGDALNANSTGRFYDAASMRNSGAFMDPLPDIAGRNGLMAGFSSLRFAPVDDPKSPAKWWSLLTAVMRFPDPAAASAAASQMAAAGTPALATRGSRRELQLVGNSTALAAAYPLSDGRETVTSFTAEREFLLYEEATMVPGGFLQGTLLLQPDGVVGSALTFQKPKIKSFVPTPVDRLPDLPMDPSGYLMARLLDNPSGAVPSNIGVWTPQEWLHFEDNPLEAAPWLAEAGVDWVGQRLSTVYRTRNPDTAETLLHKIVEQMRSTPLARPAGEVPGLPRARCFERDIAAAPGFIRVEAEAPQTMQRTDWHFKCAAATDRYVFTVYAASQEDAAQRISAQWRILAGK